MQTTQAFASAVLTFFCRTRQHRTEWIPAHWHTDAMQMNTNNPGAGTDMGQTSAARPGRRWMVAAALALSLSSATAFGQAPLTRLTDAAALMQKNTDLKSQLAGSPFGRPLVLESSESSNTVDGSVYAVLNSSFAEVSRTFKSPEQWCEVLILHINTKYCRADSNAAPTRFKVNIGKKIPQPLSDAFALDFGYELASANAGYLSVLLSAPKGPLGTSNYKIELQAIPLPDNRTFMRLHYAYGYGATSRLAMQGYLATIGAGKAGFTQLKDGLEASYVGGLRGAAERNIMRYYLAIEAYQASMTKPAAVRLESRLNHWFDATEEYPRQLREVDKSSYLSMKKDEHQRQQSAQAEK